jgi:hypothetical protein
MSIFSLKYLFIELSEIIQLKSLFFLVIWSIYLLKRTDKTIVRITLSPSLLCDKGRVI